MSEAIQGSPTRGTARSGGDFSLLAAYYLPARRASRANPVVALREIAESELAPADIEEDLVVSLQKQVELDDSEDSEAAPEKADAPEFDTLSEDEYLKAIQAAGMTKPQTLPKG